MLRLLGILSLGNLLFGGRRHRRALRRGLLFGALLGFLAHNEFDSDRVEESVRKTARDVRKTVRKAARDIKRDLNDAREEANRHSSATGKKADRVEYVMIPVRQEINENEEILKDLERHAATAAMAADVPATHSPEEDDMMCAVMSSTAAATVSST